MTDAYSTHFRKKDLAGPDEGLTQDLAYTLSCRRTHHDWRSYAIVDSNIDLKDLKRHMSKPVRVKKHAGITFAFTGQGAQYKRMGLQLLPYPEFRETLLSCDSIYQQLGCSWSLLGEISLMSDSIRTGL
jgi:acyl transferase domain-containing protein